jgi:hypothetical protein
MAGKRDDRQLFAAATKRVSKKLICNIGKENVLFYAMLHCFLDPHLSNL